MNGNRVKDNKDVKKIAFKSKHKKGQKDKLDWQQENEVIRKKEGQEATERVGKGKVQTLFSTFFFHPRTKQTHMDPHISIVQSFQTMQQQKASTTQRH